MEHTEQKTLIAELLFGAIEQRRFVALELANRGLSAFFPLLSRRAGSDPSLHQFYLQEEIDIETSKFHAASKIFEPDRLDLIQDVLGFSSNNKLRGDFKGGKKGLVSKVAKPGVSEHFYRNTAELPEGEYSKLQSESDWATWGRFFYESSVAPEDGPLLDFFDQPARLTFANSHFEEQLKISGYRAASIPGISAEVSMGDFDVIVLCDLGELLGDGFVGDHFMQSPEVNPNYKIALSRPEAPEKYFFSFPASEVLPHFFESYRYVRNARQLQFCVSAHVIYLNLILKYMAEEAVCRS